MIQRLGFIIILQCVASVLFAQADLSATLNDHVKFLSSDSLQGRGLGSEGKEIAADYIADQFAGIGLEPYFPEGFIRSFDLRYGLINIKGANIAAVIRGSDPDLKEEYILFGAHYDHLGYNRKKEEMVIYHGADDNASGVAAMIELARILYGNKDQLKRSIIFVAFDAEESGLVGSRKFAETDSLVIRNQIKAMFSIDMVGMYKTNDGLGLKGILTLVNGGEMARKAAKTENIKIKDLSHDIQSMTDTWHFGEKLIPAVHAYTGHKSPYHKPGDTYEKLDYEGMALVTRFLANLTTEMASAPQLASSPVFTRMKKTYAVRFNTGISAGAGNSWQVFKEEYYNPKGILTYHAGLFFQLHIGRILTLQPEISYQLDGAKSPDGKLQRHSLGVPFNLHLNLASQYSGLLTIYLFTGGYYLYSFSGTNGKEDIDFSSVYNRQEWGINAGAGIDIFKWQVKYTWQRSLTNFSREQSEKIYPTRWTISVGYKFLKIPK